MTEPIPLDPNEGPTVWLEEYPGNEKTNTILVGTDPDDPLKSIRLSNDEIRRLNELING